MGLNVLAMQLCATTISFVRCQVTYFFVFTTLHYWLQKESVTDSDETPQTVHLNLLSSALLRMIYGPAREVISSHSQRALTQNAGDSRVRLHESAERNDHLLLTQNWDHTNCIRNPNRWRPLTAIVLNLQAVITPGTGHGSVQCG